MAITAEGLPRIPFGGRRIVHFVQEVASAAIITDNTYVISLKESAAADVVVPWPWAWVYVSTDANFSLGNTTPGSVSITPNDTSQLLVAAAIEKDTGSTSYIVGGRPMPITPAGLSIRLISAGGVAHNGSYFVNLVSLDWWLAGGSFPSTGSGSVSGGGGGIMPVGPV